MLLWSSGLEDENSLCIALGHDLIEDTDINYGYLINEFNVEIADGIMDLTNNQESYDDFITKVTACSSNIIKIKLADLRHNMDVTRLKGFADKDIDRMNKYLLAYIKLSSINKQ